VNDSRWDCTLEPGEGRYFAVRLGLRMVKGLSNAHAAALIGARAELPYDSLAAVHRRSGVPVAALEYISNADGLQMLGLDRRQALWAIRGLADAPLPLFATEATREPAVELPPMTQGAEVVEDYRSTGLTLRSHPVAFLRADLAARGIMPCAALADLRDGARATVAGVILVRQRPGSASGVVFITIEDETGHANLVVWPPVFERQRLVVMSSSMIACRGKVQKEGEVIHVVADQMTDLSALLASIGQRDDAFPLERGRGDAVTHPNNSDPRERLIKPRTRDFH
jgi:error-prone DNA polymerase